MKERTLLRIIYISLLIAVFISGMNVGYNLGQH